MLTLEYRVDLSWNRPLKDFDWQRASVTDIRWKALQGDVMLHDESSNFDADWGWIPLVDFAVVLTEIVRNLKDTHDEPFEFTESDEEIRFHLVGDTVTITASYSDDDPMEIDYRTLRKAVRDFWVNVRTRAEADLPGLVENPEYQALRSGADAALEAPSMS
jgi:hypothetical protein